MLLHGACEIIWVMIESAVLPPDLNTAIAAESRDFVVKASKAYPLKKAGGFIIFAVFWLVFTSVFFVLFIEPVLEGKEVHFTSNGVPTVASPDNLEPLIVPAIFVGVFTLIGFSVLGIGIYMIFKEGGYFVGTPTRLLSYRKGKITSTDWTQCSGNTEVSGDDQKGSLTLELNTGHFEKSNRYVPDMLYICGIANALEIERICRQRIKENAGAVGVG